MRVLTVVGNRPQFIKSAPLSLALREAGIEEIVLHTGQHWDSELSQVFFDELGIAAPRYRLDLRTADVAAMEGPVRAVVEAEQPDWVLVFGDTNSTLAGARAAGEVAVAHVEAGLRSFDLSMPEERNRIAVDRIVALLFCPDERSAAQLRAEGVTGRRVVVGDVMADATRLFAPIARERSSALERFGVEPDGYVVVTVHREANVTRPERLDRIVEGLRRIDEPIVFPAHPRTRAALDAVGPGLELVPPLGYLDFAALVVAGACDRHRLGRGAEGGLLAPRALRHDAAEHRVGRHRRGRRERARRRRPGRDRATPSRRRAFRRGAAALRRRPGARTHRGGSVRLFAVLSPSAAAWDVAIVGAGYVGLPLAADLRRCRSERVLIVDVVPELVEPINAGESHIEDVPSDSCSSRTSRPAGSPPPSTTSTLQAGARDPDRAADAADEAARARSQLRRAGRTRSSRRSSARPARRARVDDLPRHDPRGGASRSSSEAADSTRARTSTSAMSPERVDPGRTDWTTKTTPKVVGGLTPACTKAAAASTARPSTPSTRSRRPSRPS